MTATPTVSERSREAGPAGSASPRWRPSAPVIGCCAAALAAIAVVALQLPPTSATAAPAAGTSAAPAPASPTTTAKGGPSAATGATPGTAGGTAPTAGAPGPDAVAMVAKLEARLKQQPDDREGWMMLGRAYGVMGRDKEAVEVYRKVLALSPADAATQSQAHADLGRALGKAAGRRMTPEADAELKKAIQLDPGNVMAHALLGRADFERGDAASARRHWQLALDGVDGGHPFAQQLRQSIELADNVVKAQSGKALPADGPARAAPPPPTQTR